MSELESGSGGKLAGKSGVMRNGYRAALDTGRDFTSQLRAGRGHALARDRVRDVLAAGICLVVIGFAALALDGSVAQAARHVAPGWHTASELVTGLGKSGYLFALTGITCVLAAAMTGLERPLTFRVAAGVLAGRAAYVFLVLAVSGILSILLKRSGRARPKFYDEGGAFQFDPLGIKASWSSFPSGHTVTAFAAVMALGYFLPRWRIPLFILAGLVGLSRVVLGAHYPSDVFAGACIGMASAILLRRAFAARAIVFVPKAGAIAVRGRGLILPALRRVLFR